MRKCLCIVILIVCTFALCACSGFTQVEELQKWDCSVLCTEKSDIDSYIITYSDEQIVSKSGTLSFQNRNDFDVVVHLFTNGKEERTAEIGAGGMAVLFQVQKEAVYTVGCHAEVEENTEIQLMVYDGERSEVY